MRVAVLLLAVAVAAAPALAACGARDERVASPAVTGPPPAATFAAHGVTVGLPPGWEPAPAPLTRTTDPREVLAVGTFALRYRPTGCNHLPTSALEDLGRRDALVLLMERGLAPASSWPDFPPRPARFGPELGVASEAAACAPGAHFSDRFFGIADGGRHFHVEVAFGPDASPATRAQAWAILDSLRVDPAVRPDWPASG
ncbi:MAG: hypothetical protein QOF17_902 [Solirubrobacteraceae bacterium]|jgi:hypothetical protein|nr:hypothetical protein [Solirubrobacteraceae bacterium]